MGWKTPLFNEHRAAGARIVPFGGWDMPLHYGSQIEEHHAVRRDAGMFDVSHMQVVDLKGTEQRIFLRRLLANDVARLNDPGKALYSCMLNARGGVIDDLIVYFLGEEWFRMVVNAATAKKDLAWMIKQAQGFDVEIEAHEDLAMIAVQGPKARDRVLRLLPDLSRAAAVQLKPFCAIAAAGWFVARTGYTGEDGFEVILPADAAVGFWRALGAAGVTPCGLGARDTLRLEAGLNLYGQDMDEETTPLESGLGWTLAWEPAERHFIGRTALETQRHDPDTPRFVGLVLLGRGVLRSHQKVFSDGLETGEITSGGFAPTLDKSVAFARLKADIDATCEVEIRGKRVAARVIKPPFVRNGKALIE